MKMKNFNINFSLRIPPVGSTVRKAAIDLGWKISNMTSFYRKFPTSENEVFSV